MERKRKKREREGGEEAEENDERGRSGEVERGGAFGTVYPRVSALSEWI